MCLYIVEYEVMLLEQHGKKECVNYYWLYFPTQVCFLIGGECVTCLWSKLTNTLGKKTTRTFDSHVIRSCSLKLRQSRVPADIKHDFFAVLFLFLLLFRFIQ